MNSTNPSISAVIPARDRSGTIGRAVQSVLGQTRLPLELLIVDDGSQDDLAAALLPFGDAVHLIRQPGAGAAAARNRGVQAARGEWIAFLDSDDVWLPGHLEAMARAIVDTRGTASLYFADIRQPPSEGGRLLWEVCDFHPAQCERLAPDATAWVMKPCQPMMLQTSVVNRTKLMELGGLDERLIRRHDTHLFFRLGIGSPACAVDICGGEMTDDAGESRLTTTFDSRSKLYWQCTTILYQDVLRMVPTRAASVRRELCSRLASAELQLAKHARRDSSYLSATMHLARAAYTSPTRVLAGARRRLFAFRP